MGTGLAGFWVFTSMKVNGPMLVDEPVEIILWLEIAGSVFITGFAVACWISLFKKRR